MGHTILLRSFDASTMCRYNTTFIKVSNPLCKYKEDYGEFIGPLAPLTQQHQTFSFGNTWKVRPMQTSPDHDHSRSQILNDQELMIGNKTNQPFRYLFLTFSLVQKMGHIPHQNRNSKFDAIKIRVDTVREKRIQSPVLEKARRRRVSACLMISTAPTKEDKRFLWGEPRPLSSWNAIGNSLCHWSRITKTKSVTTNRLIREYTRPAKRIKERGENSDFFDSVNATLGVAVQLVGTITIERRIQ